MKTAAKCLSEVATRHVAAYLGGLGADHVLITAAGDSNDPVHIAARIEAEAAAGEILCSSTVKELVTGSDLAFADRGRKQLKGVPQDWQIYAVE